MGTATPKPSSTRQRASRDDDAETGVAIAHRGWLYPVVFTAGAAFMALEIVGSRVLAPFFGNSVFVWGSLIGVFLAALSTGYILGGRLSNRFATPTALGIVLTIASLLAGLVVLVATPIQQWVVTWGMGPRLNPLVASLLIFAPASVLMGMVSPYAVRLSARAIASVGATAGMLYGVSTVGSIVGTLGAAFWLIPSFGTNLNIAGIAFVLALTGLVPAIVARNRAVIAAAGTVSVVMLLLVLSTAGSRATFEVQAEDWSPVFREVGYDSGIEVTTAAEPLEQVDSRYHRISIVDQESTYATGDPRADDRDALRLMQFDNSWQSGANVTAGEVDPITTPYEFRYINGMELLHAYRPEGLERVLYIGVGSGALPMRHRAIDPDVHIDAVEIDPDVIELAERWFALDTDAMDIHVADGRTWLAASDDRYDAIVIDAYFADTIPAHMTTVELLGDVADHLRTDGIVVANIIGAVEGENSKLFRSMYRTYGEVFAARAVHPVGTHQGLANFDPLATGKPGATEFQNIILLASNSTLAGYADVVARSEELVQARPVLDERMVALARHRYDAPIRLDDVPVLTDDFAPVTALLEIGY